MLAYLMLFAALTNAVCLNNASFLSLIFMLCHCLVHFLICIMHSAFNMFVFPNYMFTSLSSFFFLKIFFMKGL